MKNSIITKEEAKLLRPYLKYMDFDNLRKDRHFLAEKMMYENLVRGNISRTLIADLRGNFTKRHPGAEIPEILQD
jgi:hypothetical protein